MPLTIKISRNSSQQPTESTPPRKTSKRRANSNYADDDFSLGDDSSQRPKSKRARTVDSTEEMDVDIDGDDDFQEDDTRFLSGSESPKRTRKSTPASSSSARKDRERSKSKGSAPPTRKKRQQVVWSDDEDQQGSDVDYAGEDDADAQLVGSDDDFAPSRKRSGLKAKEKAATKGRTRSSKEKDEKSIITKDERKAVSSTSKGERNEAVSGGTKRTSAEVGDVLSEMTSPAPSALPSAVEALKEESASTTPLPSFKKRKLPQIKKNKPGTGSSAGATPQTPAARPKLRPTDPATASKDQKEPDDGLPVLKKTAKNTTNMEVDLSNKDVYASLFKSTGASVPRSGVAQKEKEERRKEFDKLRDADRARRAAALEHVFDLRAQYDKIMSFEDQMVKRKSHAIYPNILAAAFRHEKELADKQMKREQAERDREKGELLED
ncbi:hypothetical protein EVG20_g7290 [Dentipellis fragilis]|uniref:Uncharacterized protein n=1 Tax=Dentipellis fragilis TaxID=205917 RepID=A0A4Y9YIL0_9AGAM|nr:hypothetical protein EVG20_g7290 [Dentipellis fragilis]